MQERRFKGAIFDFNGTLFFDSKKHEIAWGKFAIDVRGHAFTEEEMVQYVYGRSNRSILEYLLKREIPDDVLQFFVAKKEDFYRHICLQDKKNLKLVAGAILLFEFLIGKEIPITIATASEITNLQFFNEQFGLDKWFDMDKVIFDDFKIKGKPAPDMFLAATQKLGLDPPECIIFEDSTSGVQAAKAVGIGRIIVIDPLGEQSNFKDHPDVDLVIADFTHFDANRYF